MTIEFKIGQFYRTRGGRKHHLFGIQRNGLLWFEDESGLQVETGPDGLHRSSHHHWDIVSEWREPHRHESVVYIPLILNLLREIELLTSANRLLQKRIDELKLDLATADGRPRKSRSPKRSPNLTKSPTNPEDQN